MFANIIIPTTHELVITVNDAPIQILYNGSSNYVSNSGTMSFFTLFPTNTPFIVPSNVDASATSTWNLGQLPPSGFMTGDCIHITNMTTSVAVVNILNGTPKVLAASGGQTWVTVQDTLSNSNFSDTPCCVHPDTLVSTPNGPIPIKDLKSGDMVIDLNGKHIQIKYSIKYIPTTEYVQISKGSLDTVSNKPEQDLLIRRGHPIWFQGSEVDCTNLLNGNSIRDVKLPSSQNVWSLCTDDRTFVMMNGVPVCTWSQIAWENFVKNDSTGQSMVYWTY